MKIRLVYSYSYLAGMFLLFCLVSQPVVSQTANIPLMDLSSFHEGTKSWQIAGDVMADIEKENKFYTSTGNGILVNISDEKRHGDNLITKSEYGDIELELDYMMAKGANSGIYLQGLYEVQLLDSWEVLNATAGDNGGIYGRWDPKGREGYEGYAPRVNASRAPGLWQHLKISFQAPRFDPSGKKIKNAQIKRVELNGVVIHDRIELLGPTRGAMNKTEKAKGPLLFQGDHGSVAFRNIKIINGPKLPPERTRTSNNRKDDEV
jgi:hypothetical protein